MKELFRLNTLKQTPGYSEVKKEKFISVCEHNGKIGILNDRSERVLDFKYDNITLIGLGVLQLSQDGKLGLIHLGVSAYTDSFVVTYQIPCIYDSIEPVNKETLFFLHKYTTDKDIVEYFFQCEICF